MDSGYLYIINKTYKIVSTMKKVLLAFIACTLLLASCKKEDNSKTKDSDVNLGNDQIALQGEVFDFTSTGPTFCGTAAFDHYVHYRDVRRANTTQNVPTVNIMLSKLPANGQTETFTLDNGTWAYQNSQPQGRATMRVGNYYDEAAQQQQNWFSDSLSGTITVAVSATGSPTFNFTNVKLIHTFTDMDKRKTVSCKNVVCH
ncbi:MAG: hypothetical protein BGO32_11040 [Bacteroidetes bacterium 37-13]|nr:MAG: hypothetical protein BGO32_11040 [Bacteroidetes bacterium 37-13]